MKEQWDRRVFREKYVADGGSPRSADSYVSYLNRAERVLGGLSEATARADGIGLIDRAERMPTSVWGGVRERRDSLAALRRFVALAAAPKVPVPDQPAHHRSEDVMGMLREAQMLGARYYRATGKPLGVTGEVAELEAADKLDLELRGARTPGYDAVSRRTGRRVQIKGRAVDRDRRYHGRCPSIKCGDAFDDVVLVLLDRTTLAALEIWQAAEEAVIERLRVPGSKARNDRSSLGITQFKSIAQKVWP